MRRLAILVIASAQYAGCSAAPGAGGGKSWNDFPSSGEGSQAPPPPSGGKPEGNTPPPEPPQMMDASAPIDAGGGPCNVPADCAGQVCCGKLDLAPNGMQCAINTFSASCQANCPTMVSFQCAPQQVRKCAASTDCNEANYPNCCTFSFSAKSATFCVDDVLKAYADICN
jgi:hypothetical protein